MLSKTPTSPQKAQHNKTSLLRNSSVMTLKNSASPAAKGGGGVSAVNALLRKISNRVVGGAAAKQKSANLAKNAKKVQSITQPNIISIQGSASKHAN